MRMDVKAQAEDTELEKKKQTRRLLLFSVVIIVITGVIFVVMFLNTVKNLQYVYTNRAYQDAALLKNEAIDLTVRDLVRELDQLREIRLRDEESVIRGLMPSVRALLKEEKGNSLSALKELFAGNEGLKLLTCVAMEEQSGKILLDDGGVAGETGVWTEDLEEAFLMCEHVREGGIEVVYGITSSALEAQMQEIMAERIAFLNRSTGIMYWIDRVTRLDNGRERRVRVVDPESPARVGMALDSKGIGNGPWNFASDSLTEAAEGELVTHTADAVWNEDGGESVTARTRTSALYYAPYEWAVCAAFRLDLIGVDSIRSQEDSRKETIRLGVGMALGFAVVLAIAILLILTGNSKYYHLRQKKLRDQVEKDALTGANTRGYGIQLLTEVFRRFENGSEISPALMVLDVDKFKSINDTYGHDGGDEALKRIVKSATKVMRGKDCVIRWGGDEFIAVFYKMEHARAEAVANRLRRAICDTPVKYGDQDFRVTVSIGVTWFKFGDTEYTEALKRADEALYVSKEEGRNRVCVAGGEL